jgi:hypothetical protein
MNNPLTEHHEIVQQIETLQCDRCRKKWEVGWVEAVGVDSVEHAFTCDCGRLLKVVRTDAGEPPLMILQHSYWKTVVASLPAFAAGALFPVLSDTAILTAYFLSWIACAATFINEDNSDFSALIGIAIWSMAIISAAAALGALLAHALWWW